VEKIKQPNILVIGGTGFIGFHLVKALKLRVWNVTSISLHQPIGARYVEGVNYFNIDISNSEKVKDFLKNGFQYVVNLGGYVDHKLFTDGGRELIEVHFSALQNIVEHLPRSELKRFIQIGSSDEYGNAPSPQLETIREQPISPYSLGKVASTHFLQMLHCTELFPVVVLRLFLTYGPVQNSERFIPQIIKGCLNNENFPASLGDQLRDFCYVEDTVNAIIKSLSADKALGQVINIASGKPISIQQMIVTIQKDIGKGHPKFGLIPYRSGENMNLYADIEKAKRLLNWRPKVTLKDGLKNTIEWYRENE
jgi:nucleoside-diphosphate-sugar epimerase